MVKRKKEPMDILVWKHNRSQEYIKSNSTICPWCGLKLEKRNEGFVCKGGATDCPLYFKNGKGWVLIKEDYDKIVVEKMFLDSFRLKFAREWIKLKEKILRRDNYTCQNDNCNYKLKDDWMIKIGLQVHHIIPVSKNNALYLDEDNLITLCSNCHSKIHSGDKYKWGGKYVDKV